MKVYCNECNEHIYNLNIEPKEGLQLYAWHFSPANSDIKQPKDEDQLICPYCGLNFLIPTFYNSYKVKTDKGILP